MCKVRNGHDYSEDARREMNGNGDRWLHGLSDWLKKNWLILVVASMAIGWVFRMEVFAQAGPRFTPDQAREMELRWEQRFDSLPPDNYERYIEQRFKDLEKQIDSVHADVIIIRDNI